jgi:hypothetical protein
MATSALAFVLVFLGTIIKRILVVRNYNSTIRNENGRILVTATKRAMELATHLMEFRAYSTFRDVTNRRKIRDDIIFMYDKFGYSKRKEELMSGDELAENPPDYQLLYRQVREAMSAYEKCNSLVPPRTYPFPIYDILVYIIAALIIVATAAYLLSKVDIMRRISVVNRLHELRRDIEDGMEPPGDFNAILECSSPKNEVWNILTDIAIGTVVLLNILVLFTLYRSTAMYGIGLRSSRLFLDRKCV